MHLRHILIIFTLASCWSTVSGVDLAEARKRLGTPDPATIPWPDGVPPSQALVDLGRTLFFDRRLSAKQNQSCASCHNPELGLSDGLALGIGTNGNRVGRNAPHLYNLAWSTVLYWDGRMTNMDEQATKPIQSKSQMAMDLGELEARLRGVAAYRTAFHSIFGDPAAPADGSAITRERLGQAIAAFERTLVSRDSAFDRHLAGAKDALMPEAVRGLDLFLGKANCIACHSGPNFTDDSFHNIGVKSADAGRAAIVPGALAQNAFRTPGLRNIALTAPYMHDGSIPTLEAVVRFYARGGDAPTPDTLVRKIDLSEGDIRDLIAFLSALSDPLRIPIPAVP